MIRWFYNWMMHSCVSCLQGAGGSETAGDARPASRAAGSSATGSAAALLSEDETLDVDGETAPLIDEDA